MTHRNHFFYFLLVFLFIAITLPAVGQEKDYPTDDEIEGLPVDTTAPLFTAQNQHGETFDLSEALKEGPVVLLFYRGQWCPVCNKHLTNLQDSLSYIEKSGAKLVAVSPEQPELLEETRAKTGAQFELLYDKDYKIGLAYRVIFLPSKSTRTMYNMVLGAHLSEAHSDKSERLPVPATYIIDQNGEIIWRHFNPDYKKRASVKAILKHLPASAN